MVEFGDAKTVGEIEGDEPVVAAVKNVGGHVDTPWLRDGLEGDESRSLERLYHWLRQFHGEIEVAMADTVICRAQLATAQRNLDKARGTEEKIRAKIDDVELAILDRRRAERGGGVTT